MRTKFDAKHNRYSFDSLREIGTWIDATPRTWGEVSDAKSANASNSWDLGAGYDGAVKLARTGWIEGAQNAQAKLKALNAKQPTPRERNDFYGFRPHVPRYCAGAPDCMIRHEGDTGSGQSLSLVVDVCANGGTRAENMSNWGVAVAHYIKQLELDGTRCDVWAAISHQLRGARQTFSVCIKRAGQPLDLAVMSFAIGHPAMLRRIGFAAMERSKARRQPGYGYCVPVELADVLDAPATAVVVHGMNEANYTASTPEAALEALSAEINSKQKG